MSAAFPMGSNLKLSLRNCLPYAEQDARKTWADGRGLQTDNAHSRLAALVVRCTMASVLRLVTRPQ